MDKFKQSHPIIIVRILVCGILLAGFILSAFGKTSVMACTGDGCCGCRLQCWNNSCDTLGYNCTADCDDPPLPSLPADPTPPGGGEPTDPPGTTATPEPTPAECACGWQCVIQAQCDPGTCSNICPGGDCIRTCSEHGYYCDTAPNCGGYEWCYSCIGCFTAGTQISVPEGEKDISQLRPGEKVKSFDPGTGQNTVATIDAIHEATFSAYYKITTKSGKKIMVTGEHPLWAVREEKADSFWEKLPLSGWIQQLVKNIWP